jgi:hypothetical protein
MKLGEGKKKNMSYAMQVRLTVSRDSAACEAAVLRVKQQHHHRGRLTVLRRSWSLLPRKSLAPMVALVLLTMKRMRAQSQLPRNQKSKNSFRAKIKYESTYPTLSAHHITVMTVVRTCFPSTTLQ